MTAKGKISGALLGAFVAAILALPALAPAAQVHAFSTSFGEPGTAAGQLELAFPELEQVGPSNKVPTTPGSFIAVDDETGEIYVADTGNHRVSEFSAAGDFIRSFGADVGGAGVDVCTTICGPGTAGHEPGQLDAPTFIALDNDPSSLSHGDVYVADTAGAENRVSKYDAEGKLIEGWGKEGQLDGSTATGGPFEAIQGIATDPKGDLWVRGGVAGATLFEFDQAGTFVQEWATSVHIGGTQPTGIALDGAEPEHLYRLEGFAWGPIYRFTTNGDEEGAIFGRERTFFTGIAADQRTHHLFVDQEGNSIADLPPGCQPVPGEGQGACPPAQVFGEGEPGALHKAAGLGVNSATGTVYAAETQADEVFAYVATLEATTEAATAVEATTAVGHGTVDPKGTSVTRCRFQYGTTTDYGAEAPCLNASGEEVGTVTDPIATTTALHADLTGLAGGSKYHFRLRVSNAKPEFLSSEDEEFITKTLASIDEASATEVTATSATLNARINPHGLATEYRFEYGPCSSPSACSTSPFPNRTPETDQAIGSGTSPVSESQPITGLAPNTTYHFRVVAVDANGTVTSPEHTFVFLTEPAAGHGSCPANEALREENASTSLPDCRAYELVTPIAKNGSLIGALFVNNIPPQIALDGSRVIAPAIQCFAGSGSCVGTRQSEGEPFQFERSGSGWSTEALALPAATFHTSTDWGFNADSGAALFSSPSAPNNQDDFYARSPGSSLVDLGPVSEGPTDVGAVTGESLVTTADSSHVVWSAQFPFWSFDPGKSTNISLYAYPGPEGSTSEPQLVAVTGAPGSHELIGRCSSVIAGFETKAQSFGTLSADGRTTYFRVERCAEGSGPVNEHLQVPVRELYARIDGERPDARTVAISEPGAPQAPQANPACTTAQCLANTDPTKPQSFRDAEFQGGSIDGTMAYFSSPQQLTDEATQDPNSGDTAFAGGCTLTTGANGCNLYLYENPQQKPLTGTHLIDVSAGDTSGIGPEVQGMFALSTDGTHAYFVAKGVLSEAPNSVGDHAVEGQNNLYLYQRDGAHPQGQLTFVARLSDADNRGWAQGISFANTTPDGRYLVFESGRGLTPDARSEGARQIYRYDAVTGGLRRLSFGLAGFNDDGNAAGAGAKATIAPLTKATVFRSGPVRSDPTMSNDGSLVFFQSPVALVPGSLDEVELGAGFFAENIYEWEEAGHGGCSEPRGCISLISDGLDTAEKGNNIGSVTELLGTDAAGANVFFATSSRLNWADTDTQRDYYDARVGGGFAKPAEASICAGDNCKGPGTEAGSQASPATPTFSGPEEGPKHPRSSKHKRRRQKHKKNHHTKNGKKRHHKQKGGGR